MSGNVVRVYDVARACYMTSREVIFLMDRLGQHFHSPSAVVEPTFARTFIHTVKGTP